MASVAKFDTWQASDGTNVARFNAGALEVWDGSAWAAAGAPTFNYLVIAGGGSGGGASGIDTWGGGGGAGGYRNSISGELSGGSAVAENPIGLSAGTFTVTVGAGAAGVAGFTPYPNQASNSQFASIISVGGGFGGTYYVGPGNGGSGGGGASSRDNDQIGAYGISPMGSRGGNSSGNAGSTTAGGGGAGAGAVGVNASGTSGGAGGAGLSSSITGSSVTRAGGGGGGRSGAGGAGGGGAGGGYPNQDGFNATANTGSGGGGSARRDAGNAVGGNGGSGLVVIKYPDSITLTIDAGLTSSTSSAGGFKTTTFTAGTGPVSF